MTKIALNGCNGRMGKVLQELISKREDCSVIYGIDLNNAEKTDFPVFTDFAAIPENLKADVIIDFSHPKAMRNLLDYSISSKTPTVIATTGIAKEDMEYLKEAGKSVAVFHSANMSIGICLLKALVQKAALFLGDDFDIEIVERHHNQKLDAPSGTALAIADAINNACDEKFEYIYDRHSRSAKRGKTEISISAVRGGSIIGDHEVIFAGNNEVIEVNHKAQSRNVFADGAVKAALFLASKPAGLYSMESMINM